MSQSDTPELFMQLQAKEDRIAELEGAVPKRLRQERDAWTPVVRGVSRAVERFGA